MLFLAKNGMVIVNKNNEILSNLLLHSFAELLIAKCFISKSIPFTTCFTDSVTFYIVELCDEKR